MATLDDGARGTVREIVERLKDSAGALLPILHEIQRVFRHVPPEAVPIVADHLNVSRAEVHGVIGFYHYFRTTPPGARTLYLCRAEACQSMQARTLEDHAKARLGCGFHETSPDGRFSLEPVYCLGNCALAPAMMIDTDLFGRVTPERFDAAVADRAGDDR